MLSRRSALLSLASLLAACASASSRSGADRLHDARTFYATTAFSGGAFSSDGRNLLITSDRSGIFNAHALSLETGELTALTHSTTDAITAVDWFPGDGRILTTADQGGNELHHLYVREENGESRDLTPGTGLKARFLRWSADRRSFFVLTNERDPKFFDLYRYRFGAGPNESTVGEEIAPGYRREVLLANPGGFDLSGVSADGRWVVLTKTNDNADTDLFLVSTSTPGERVLLTPHQGKVRHAFADFSPDGARVYYTTDEGGEFASVWSCERTTLTRKPVFAADWDVSAYAFSEDGRWLTTSVNADARTILRVFEAATGREVILPRLPAGDVSDVVFERDGSRLVCTVNGDSAPPDLYLVDLTTGAQQRLTDALPPEISSDDLVEAEGIRYPSFDGLAIPALLYRPRQASPTNRAPAIVWVHGGPGGQSRHGYNPTIQHLVNHGYAVLAVNNRGSSGYGKTFFHLDDRRHGDVDLKDCIAARRHLETLDWVDGERVGILGGSYGGYMVCAALAFAPEAFDVGIDIFGVTNWIRTLESIPPWWAEFRDSLYAELGDPAVDRASLEARSPLLHASNIRRPLLVVQGKNDPRVSEAESEEIAAAVRRNGVPVEYVLFPDEGHGFRNKENRIRASEAYLAFLETWLRGARADR